MKIQNGYLHLVKTAIEDFKRNKVRTLLTSLGIMIGVLSVVLLIALGLGLKNYIKQQFESLGANLIIIFPGNISGDEGGGVSNFGAGFAGGASFDEKDLNSLSRINEADYLVPLFMKSSFIEAGTERKFGYVMGTNEQSFKLLNLDLLEGDIFTKGDISARAKKAVLGESLADAIFDNPEDAVGKTIRIAEQRYKVIGVYKKKGDQQQDNAAVVPYKTTYGSLNPDETFFTMYLGTTDETKVDEIKAKAKEILLRRYNKDDFTVTEQTEILSTVNQIFAIVNGVLVAIGSISLVVGGIGIMNIMYATVTERTKEVGIRRAVGATEEDILKQFLTESLLLSLFGGVFGLILASLIVLGVRAFFPASINLLAVIIAFVVSSAIGVFFGVFPARRAAKLPPIEAIRYE
ncbi:MAG: Macrolide export ATP-binding/permease protein MacB [Candidatus Woesebacteria bacterium GW2011_GWA1_37_7]|uniref:Macrolide export ATP-binding/permease protein MacB n=1 Tax=Candidatus Woesebacteria bacterium GW2011_GWA1_37_7 TaxID=1618545 RepID=A0A0G0K7N5_9BACT|nr:MAG: Macrolide export ATP-binding/permease protein MacB [Candidatus Woesebacteria bacterium GW2011_GWA1_37_7]